MLSGDAEVQIVSPFRVPPTFVAQVTAPEPPPLRAWWFCWVGDRLLVLDADEPQVEPQIEAQDKPALGLTLPCLRSLADLGFSPGETQFLGWLDGVACYATALPPEALVSPPVGYRWELLRELYGLLPEALFAIAGRAIQLVAWDHNHRFCGRCATPMVQRLAERAKHCPSCGLRNYPRLSPAVIMLVARGEALLLARSPRFRPGMYSVLAGFVEPGESLEEAVAREVREEVGIEVANIRYFGSQPWPFPDSLMMGFMAEYAAGEIAIDPAEIEAADWFLPASLPTVPGKLSIARKLIDAFVAENAKG